MDTEAGALGNEDHIAVLETKIFMTSRPTGFEEVVHGRQVSQRLHRVWLTLNDALST